MDKKAFLATYVLTLCVLYFAWRAIEGAYLPAGFKFWTLPLSWNHVRSIGLTTLWAAGSMVVAQKIRHRFSIGQHAQKR